MATQVFITCAMNMASIWCKLKFNSFGAVYSSSMGR